jgi:Haem-binding domain
MCRYSSALANGRASVKRVLPLFIVFLILALIAFGSLLSGNQMDHVSPAVHDYSYAEPFRGTEGRKALARACGNCHSNQTNLPWYGQVMPISWWIKRHVREGRQALNFTEWTTYSARRQRDELESICGVRMPPASYRVLHPESRLEAEDKKLICAWAAIEWEREK